MDLLVPVGLGNSGAVFLETSTRYGPVHSMWHDSIDTRVDASVGIGARKAWKDSFLGVNAFWDRTRLDGKWLSSRGVGTELILSPAPERYCDLSLNLYQGGGVDAQLGYMFPVLDKGLDMRLKVEKYRFFDSDFVLGWKAGFDLLSADRTFALTYEYGQDSRRPSYHAVGCSLSLAFQLENIFSLKNPFLEPDPFRPGERTMEAKLSSQVKRAWRQPGTVVAARSTPQGKRWTTPGKVRWTRDDKPKESEIGREEKNRCSERVIDGCCEKPRGRNDWDEQYCTKQLCDRGRSTGEKDGFKCTLGKDCLGKICAAVVWGASEYLYRWTFGPYELNSEERERIRMENLR